ncbi:MAG: hypothetical protein HZA04_05410 [Nitrospinae bacterium]|nr:hypothetical protein [Nitrospinota bacterium]
MKMIDWWGTKAVALFLIINALLSSPAIAGERRPFDLSKVPMDDGWEDTGINAYTIEPCGKDSVYMGLEYLEGEPGKAPVKLRVRNLITGVEKTSSAEPRQTQEFLGCTPDSRYLLIQKSPPVVHPPHKVDIYDTATMQVVASFSNGKGSDHFLRLMSPDGRYLITGDKKSVITLPDGRAITTLPLLDRLRGVFSTAWSADGRKVYVLHDTNPQLLLIHDVETDRQRFIQLVYDYPDQFGVEVMAHPKTGRVYIRAGILFDHEIEFRDSLLMFDPATLPAGAEKVEVRPKILGDTFATMTFGPDDTFFFSLMPDPEAETPSFPEEYSGIFIADTHGKVLKRVTKERYDNGPTFMPEVGYLIISRKNTLPGIIALTMRTILKQRNPTRSSVPAQAKKKN